MTDKEIINRITRAAKKHYSDTGPHGWTHVMEVLQRARKIEGGDPLPPYVVAAAVYHDCGIRQHGIANHPRSSAQIAYRELTLMGVISSMQIHTICNAIKAHHAPNNRSSSRLELLLATAVKEPPPTSISCPVRNKYGSLILDGYSHEDAVTHTFTFIKLYYERGEIALSTSMYKTYYANELQKLSRVIRDLTVEDVSVLVM